MKLLGFHVSVYSDDKRLKEHSVVISPDGKKATCWIPSECGKKFGVKCNDGKSSTIRGRAKSVHVFLDGQRMRKCAYLSRNTSVKIGGVHVADNAMRPFVFAAIQTTDEGAEPDNNRVELDKIGTIIVNLFLVKHHRPVTRTSKNYEVQDLPPAVLDERTKKAGEHCTSLGSQEPCSSFTRYTSSYDVNNPDLIFEFHYRPAAVLQAMRIIPLPKREAPPIIDLEDEDGQPPLKQQKKAQEKDFESMQAELEHLRSRVGELEREKAGPSGVKKEGIKCDPADIIDLT